MLLSNLSPFFSTAFLIQTKQQPGTGTSLTQNDKGREVTWTLVAASGDLLFLLLFDSSWTLSKG